MCGIAGFAGVSDRGLLEAMTQALVHRGPDEAGFYHQGGVGLGSRRLAVIDLKSGTQPIAGESGATIVFNGEIYNFASLRERLEKAGHRFKTRSDTEVIVHLYEERGLDALGELSGMFALALWDPRKATLLLARDPMGVKPLYYAVRGGRLYFGSELKALRKVPGLALEPDLESLDHYLDYLYIPSPRTIYRDVHKLLPGERLVWHGGAVERSRFWKPEVREEAVSREEAERRLDGLLARVLRDQVVADVPVGLFLSGGLDSSAVAAYLARQGISCEAFCAHYGEKGAAFNELEKARSVAGHFGLRLTELRIRPDVPAVMEEMVQALDEPLADSSALPTYWVSREARRRVKVALTGIGGDELFGGYTRYAGARLFEAYAKLPLAVRRALRHAVPLIPEQVSSRNVGSWVRRFLSYGTSSAPEAYAGWMGHLGPGEKEFLYGAELARAGAAARPAPLEAFESARGDLLQRILAVDMSTYLPDDLLALADRASMAHGLELRVPLCDQRLAEFALTLPSRFRVGRDGLKPLLKGVLRGKLPPGILSQRKQGFMIPLGLWFKEELKGFAEDALRGLSARGLVRAQGAGRLFHEHLSGESNRTDVLWAMTLLEHWFRRHHPGFRLEGGS